MLNPISIQILHPILNLILNPNIQPNIKPNIQPNIEPNPQKLFCPPKIYIQWLYVSQCAIFRDTIASL